MSQFRNAKSIVSSVHGVLSCFKGTKNPLNDLHVGTDTLLYFEHC